MRTQRLITLSLALATQVVGPSMIPTLNSSGDLILYETLSVRRNKLGNGDVVILTSPKDAGTILCKRIIAMEGETVDLESSFDGRITSQKMVPKGHVWVQGDNLSNSSDSRSYGAIPKALIKGKAVARIYPQVKWLENTLDFAHTPVYNEFKSQGGGSSSQRDSAPEIDDDTTLAKSPLRDLILDKAAAPDAMDGGLELESGSGPDNNGSAGPPRAPASEPEPRVLLKTEVVARTKVDQEIKVVPKEKVIPKENVDEKIKVHVSPSMVMDDTSPSVDLDDPYVRAFLSGYFGADTRQSTLTGREKDL